MADDRNSRAGDVRSGDQLVLDSIRNALRANHDDVMSESAASQRVTLEAVSHVLKGRLAQVVNQAVIAAEAEARRVVATALTPEVTVNNDVGTPSVTVQVDMTPVAQALKAVAGAIGEMSDMIGQLVESMPKEPPSVTVEQPRRKGRRLRIKHDDGSETVVTEE